MARYILISVLAVTFAVVGFDAQNVSAEPADRQTQSIGEEPLDPMQATCGDGQCQPPEDCNSCPQDCGNCCGNHRCEPPEDCNSCPQDCGNC